MDLNENTEDKTLETSSEMEVSESKTEDNSKKQLDKISSEETVTKENNCSDNTDSTHEESNIIEDETAESKNMDNVKINTPQNDSKTVEVEKEKDNDINFKNSNNVSNKTECSPMDTSNVLETPTIVKDIKEGRRKRKSVNSTHSETVSPEQNGSASKRKKLDIKSDRFCWRCHKESVEAQCTACPRSWHRRCMGGAPPLTATNWLCGECAGILQAENVETRSPAMASLTIDQLCMMLKHVVERMRDQHGSAPFWKAVDLEEVPNYLEYVVKPMDLSLLETNVRAKLYGSTDAFMADARWIQHNCIVFNTCGGVYADTSKLTNTAKQMLKVARQEVSEIEACPDCFAHGRNLPRPLPSWFIEPCRRAHPIVWAKLKGFPFWPAKAMPRLNAQGLVDVRFFGEHDRAWVSPKDIYLYSPEPPVALPKKKKLEMEVCVKEVEEHSKKLELVFGEFRYAPAKVQYDPHDLMQIKLLLPYYDPISNTRIDPPKTIPEKKNSPVNNKKLAIIVDKKSPNLKNVEASTNGVIENPVERRKLVRKKKSIEPLQQPVNKLNDEVESNTHVTKSNNKSPPATPTIINNNSANHELSNSNSVPKISTVLEVSNNLFPKRNTTPVRKVNNSNIRKIKLLRDFNKEDLKKTNVIIKNARVVNAIKPPLPALNSLQNHTENLKVIASGQKPKRIYISTNLKKPANLVTGNAKINAKIPQQENRTVNRTLNRSFNKEAIKFPVHNKDDTLSININKPMTSIPISTKKDQTKAMFLAMNSNTSESARHFNETDSRLPAPITVIKQEPKDDVQPKLTIARKPSKARKSFPNKPPNIPRVSTASSSSTHPLSKSSSVGDAMVYIPTQSNNEIRSCELPPPEAGPISAKIHQSSKELANRLAQLIADTIKDAAENNNASGDNIVNHHEATIHYLKLKMERMKWEHQQEISEVKHNHELVLREMKAGMEVERYRALQDARREAEIDKMRCIEETKRKQWCVVCGREAMFYCCWNTAYCDYPCQEKHWTSHIATCAQKTQVPQQQQQIVGSSPSSSSQSLLTTGNMPKGQEQVMPKLVINKSPQSSITRRA